MTDLSGATLILRCINGEKRAWDKFVQQFSPLILWAIKKRLSRANYHYSQQDLEDIFQNVFVLLWEKAKLQQIKSRDNISTWLVMVAANCALNYFRNKKEQPIDPKLTLEIASSSNCHISETVKLEEVFNLLPPRERVILQLSYLYDKTHQEIGEILKMPANTVSSIIGRTKERLKKRLGQDEEQ